MKRKTPPTNQEMEPLWKMQKYVEFEDIVAWRDEVGVRKGVVYENGRVLFNVWLVRPHEQIVNEFNAQCAAQYNFPYMGTAHYPVLINDGTQGIYLSRMNLMC
jgi:hypothetical protein